MKVFAPKAKLETPVVKFVGDAITAVPPVVHSPFPITGLVAVNVPLSAQTVSSGPALATLGVLFVIFTSSEAVQLAELTVQVKVFTPAPNPLTVVLFNVGIANTPAPACNVHKPVSPPCGAFPVNVALSAQIVASAPAFTVTFS